ncbi:hypothetical protein IX296_002223 [Bacteroides pyogenes]|nr:hypothetical protein [Bacteroides pyogenes]MBR8725930.1 hypothetical protein [Bacteroides pyogenes]MBR8739210.1 hypothetical protein [Bacteroides pyogenes]MBR8755109.1 hypothetical protein [Bacteroides pyogenes]MBR8796399.1 hypothetical protein [Bacteroides pyogenes]
MQSGKHKLSIRLFSPPDLSFICNNLKSEESFYVGINKKLTNKRKLFFKIHVINIETYYIKH